jgi:hypothetical protein
MTTRLREKEIHWKFVHSVRAAPDQGSDFATAHQQAAIQFHGGLSPEKVQQNGHALTAIHGFGHYGFEAVQSAARNFDGIARLKFRTHRFGFTRPQCIPEFLNDVIRNGGPTIPEVNDVVNTARSFDPSEMVGQIKSREEVIEKERFGDPGQPGAIPALESDAWQEDFNLQSLSQLGRGRVLAFHLSAHAEPGEAFGRDRLPRLIHGSNGDFRP